MSTTDESAMQLTNAVLALRTAGWSEWAVENAVDNALASFDKQGL